MSKSKIFRFLSKATEVLNSAVNKFDNPKFETQIYRQCIIGIIKSWAISPIPGEAEGRKVKRNINRKLAFIFFTLHTQK